jgi:hypothetical protein
MFKVFEKHAEGRGMRPKSWGPEDYGLVKYVGDGPWEIMFKLAAVVQTKVGPSVVCARKPPPHHAAASHPPYYYYYCYSPHTTTTTTTPLILLLLLQDFQALAQDQFTKGACFTANSYHWILSRVRGHAGDVPVNVNN